MTENHPDVTPMTVRPHSARRLSDKILIAFHAACDRGDAEVAWELLRVLEFMTRRMPNLPTGRDHRAKESLVAAHERLWEIRRSPPRGADRINGSPR